MHRTIHLDPNQVPAHLRGSYTGKQFKAIVCETVDIPTTAGLWEGGSRDLYSAIDFATGRQAELPGQRAAPWSRNYHGDRTIRLQPGFAIVEHSIFCGKDTGLTFYVHPDNAAKLLPAPTAELTPHETVILYATRSFKSSYAGRDRYEMAREDYRVGKLLNGATYPTREQWETAKASLVVKGLLNKAGAITNAGRNAAPSY